MDIKNLLKELSNAVSLGSIDKAVNLSAEKLGEFCEIKRMGKTVIGRIDNGKDYTLLIDAHSDEVGMVVTDVDENGFLTVGNCGGIDLRHLSAKPVIIHGESEYTGVFVSTPPHLKSESETTEDISEIKIDSLLGSDAKNKIKVGDFVSFATRAFNIGEYGVAGKSLDNRAGVACILELASRLKNANLPCNLIFLLSDAEELGLRGAKTAAFDIQTDEAVVIDVSFGDGPDIAQNECGKLRGGAMIGISPCIDRKISDTLISVARDNGINYQTEIMSETTSTNADVLSVNKTGIRTGLISIPLRNMHTDTEIVDIRDLQSVCDILEKYILSGGIKNA